MRITKSSSDVSKNRKKSASKIMATVLWDDARGVILVNFLLNGERVNSEAYSETFKISEQVSAE